MYAACNNEAQSVVDYLWTGVITGSIAGVVLRSQYIIVATPQKFYLLNTTCKLYREWIVLPRKAPMRV